MTDAADQGPERNPDPGPNGQGPLLRRAPPCPQHRRHEEDRRFLLRRPRHAAGRRIRVKPEVGTGPDNRGNPPFENLRHYFFDMGNDSMLAFFEMPKGAKPQGDRDSSRDAACLVRRDAGQPEAHLRAARRPPRCRSTGRWKSCPASSRSMCSTQTTSTWSSPASRATAKASPCIVPQVTQTKNEALRELKTLTGDKGWLDRATAGLGD